MELYFVSHPYRGDYNNYQRAKNIVETLELNYGWKGKHFLCPLQLWGGNYFYSNYDDIRGCLLILSKCDAIIMSLGWENSRGCKMELFAAKMMGKKIIYELDHGRFSESLSK